MAAKLLTCSGLKNEASASKNLPSRLKVLNWGVNKTLKGDITVDERTMKVFSQVQEKMGWDTIALDYEHGTVPGTTAYKESAEPRPVAAHLNCSIVENDGLYCDVKDWTPSGKLNAKNYADLSPSPLAIEMGDENVLIGCHSVALTQHGAVPGLEFLSADLPDDIRLKLITLSSEMPAFMKGTDSNVNGHTNMSKDQIKTFRTFLGMADSTPDDEVMKCMSAEISSGKICRTGPLDKAGGTDPKVKTFGEDGKKLEHMIDGSNPGLKKFNMDDINAFISEKIAAAITPLSATVKDMTTAAQNASKAAEDGRRAELIREANSQYKILPLSAEELKTISLPILESLVKNTPRSSLTNRRTPEAIVKQGATGRIVNNGSRVLTMNADGQIILTETAPIRQDRSIDRTKANFQEQIERLNHRQ